MLNKKIRSFLLLLLLFSFSVEGRKPDLVFQHLNIHKGFTQRTVRTIIEDKKGYMWFASEDGISRYDGKTTYSYKSTELDNYSISSNNVTSVFNDSKGNLWIATRYGLNLYDHDRDRFFNHRSGEYKCFDTLIEEIEAITEDENGNIWFTSSSHGLFKISSLDKKPVQYQFKDDRLANLFLGVKADKNGKLWVGTRDGILSFNIDDEKFTDHRDAFGQGYEVTYIHIEKDSVWFATNHGLGFINLVNNTFKQYKHDPQKPFSINNNNVASLVNYDEKSFLIALDGSGVDYFDKRTEKFYHYTSENEAQLSCKNIVSIYKDSKDDIWVGTYMNGLHYFNNSSSLFSFIKNNPNSNQTIKSGIVSFFLEDQNKNLWVATDGGGLYIRRKADDSFRPYEPIPGKGNLSRVPLVAMQEDGNKFWISTYGGGLVMFELDKPGLTVYKNDPLDVFTLSNNHLRGIYKDKIGNIWVSEFGTGISVLDRNTGNFKHLTFDSKNPYSIPDNWVQRFFEDSKGNLWLASHNGLSRYDSNKDEFHTYRFKSNKISSKECNYIFDIYEDKSGIFWLATNGGGIIEFNLKENKYKFYTSDNGLTDNIVRSVIEDDFNNLWLATNNGITRFNLIEKKAKAYTYRDGTPPYAPYANSKFKDKEGRVYFGCNDGYLRIDPRIVNTNIYRPPVYITNIKISNFKEKEPYQLRDILNVKKKITLEYAQNAILIDYVALNYNNTQRNNYAYKLEGFDTEWNHVGNTTFAHYTNLNPGKYKFVVKGSNNDNIWNIKGDSLTIIILPPWYQTWWFFLIQMTLGLLMLLGFVKWRVKSVHKQNEILEEVVIKRTKELKDSNEQLDTFVYKASHDIKGPLKSIIGLTTVGLKDVSDAKAKVYFEHILSSTKKLDKLLLELLQLTKVKQATIKKEVIDFDNLTKEILCGFSHLPEYNKINFSIEIDQKVPFVSDRNLISSIIQNLIENPIKYYDPEKAEPYLKIKISSDKKNAKIVFEDNGIGIEKGLQERVFDMFFKVNEISNGTGLGLYIVKTTIDKLGGKIVLQSALKKGCTFKVIIPQLS